MGCQHSNTAVKYETAEVQGSTVLGNRGSWKNEQASSGSAKTNSHRSSGKPAAHQRRSITETKINQALLKKKLEHEVDKKPITFEKILLKFDKLRVVLGYVKQQFNQVAKDGKLDHDGLKAAMKRLSVNMTLEDILDLFDFVNVSEATEIHMKEFLVALTVGMVLDVIPALSNDDALPSNNPESSSSTSAPVLRRSFSGFLGHNHEIKEMLNLIVSAYLIFDPEGKGYIIKGDIDKLLVEQGGKGGKSSLLSQQRWNEMDWDANGTIDFAEFVFSFTSWIDIEDE